MIEVGEAAVVAVAVGFVVVAGVVEVVPEGLAVETREDQEGNDLLVSVLCV